MAEPLQGIAPVVAENARPGDADWALTRPALGRQIEGYASACSVAAGGVIDLFVHTEAERWQLEVFRIGWYGGVGARRVLGPIEQAGTAQPMPAMDDTGLVDCDWRASVRLVTATAEGHPWCSGVYLARLTEQREGHQSYIVFVVRDDTRRTALVVQLAFTTWQAYNNWGGKSLYNWGSSEGERATRVSFNRPFGANLQNPAAAYGMGAGEFITNVQPHPDRYGARNAGWDINTVRWLEREGHDVTYTTSLDTHARPATLRQGGAWLSIGHDEYWSRPMREQVEAARDAGVHLGFLTANAAYWQVRLEDSPATGQPLRLLVCSKKAKRDPLRKTDPASRVLTDKWRSEAVGQPEEALIGVMYLADPIDADLVVKAADHWLFAGTGLKAGDRLPGLLGYEVDGVHDAQAAAARGLQLLCESPWTSLQDATVSGVAHMSLYQAASGAFVFATGSMQWAWGLDDYNAPALRPALRHPAAEQMMRNLLARFGSHGQGQGPGAPGR